MQIRGSWRLCAVVYGANNKIKPNAVLVDGQEQIHPEGRYYLDFRQDGKRLRRAAGGTAPKPEMRQTRRRKS